MPAATNVKVHNFGDTYARTCDWSPGIYVTGGVVIGLADLGLPSTGVIEYIDCPGVQGTRLFEVVFAAGVWKIKVYTAINTEVANATDLSAVTIKLKVIAA